MNIIMGQQNVQDLDDKYTVLELDTFRIQGSTDPVTAYCLVEHLPLEEMLQLESFKELHTNLIKNYRLKNWRYCEDAIEHLMPRWGGELRSYYEELSSRINSLKQQDLEPDWDGIITKMI